MRFVVLFFFKRELSSANKNQTVKIVCRKPSKQGEPAWLWLCNSTATEPSRWLQRVYPCLMYHIVYINVSALQFYFH